MIILKSDFKVEVGRAREELGLSNPDMSKKVSLYSLSRLVEMILQYLMISSLYSEQDAPREDVFNSLLTAARDPEITFSKSAIGISHLGLKKHTQESDFRDTAGTGISRTESPADPRQFESRYGEFSKLEAQL
mmetsp:Transcript_36224/g.55631  ORF Transcript_36224/g.55631 Transcript_36224/m.55631 type:complete len:133 (+) Transcript_36224:2373-2771(+)